MFNKFILNEQMQPWTQYGIVKLTGIYDSIIIQEKKYSNVKRYLDTKNSIEGNDSTNFYISKNLGIIRKEIFINNSVWNLVNYYIVK